MVRAGLAFDRDSSDEQARAASKVAKPQSTPAATAEFVVGDSVMVRAWYRDLLRERLWT
jgi:hypothetical protein